KSRPKIQPCFTMTARSPGWLVRSSMPYHISKTIRNGRLISIKNENIALLLSVLCLRNPLLAARLGVCIEDVAFRKILEEISIPNLHVPEEQFLALKAQVVDVADVVAIAIDVVENDAARRRPLDVLAQVPRRESTHAPVCLNRPIHRAEAFFRGDDACDGRHEVTPLQLLLNEFPVLGAEFRRVDDQSYFNVRAVADTQEAVRLGKRECAQDAHFQIGTIFFDRQPQRSAAHEEA